MWNKAVVTCESEWCAWKKPIELIRIVSLSGTVFRVGPKKFQVEASQIPDGALQIPDEAFQIPSGTSQIPDGTFQIPSWVSKIPGGAF